MEVSLTRRSFEFLEMLKKNQGKFSIELTTTNGGERQGWKRILKSLKEKGLIDFESVGTWTERIPGYPRIYRIGIKGLKVRDYKIIKKTSRNVVIKV